MGGPIIRTIVFGGLYWGPLFLGNYHITHYSSFHFIFHYPHITPRLPGYSDQAADMDGPKAAGTRHFYGAPHAPWPGMCRSCELFEIGSGLFLNRFWGYIGGYIRGRIGIMAKKMETTILNLHIWHPDGALMLQFRKFSPHNPNRTPL